MADGSDLIRIALYILKLIYGSLYSVFYLSLLKCLKRHYCDLNSITIVFPEIHDPYNRGYFADLWHLVRNFTSQGFTYKSNMSKKNNMSDSFL